jgi:hypothetical protein
MEHMVAFTALAPGHPKTLLHLWQMMHNKMPQGIPSFQDIDA